MANPFVHVELATTDVGKAKSFYQTLFGWRLHDKDVAGGHKYTMIDVGEGTGGGMMQHPVPGASSAWLAYVLVDDLAAATKRQSRSAPRSCASRPRSWVRARSRSSSNNRRRARPMAAKGEVSGARQHNVPGSLAFEAKAGTRSLGGPQNEGTAMFVGAGAPRVLRV